MLSHLELGTVVFSDSSSGRMVTLDLVVSDDQ